MFRKKRFNEKTFTLWTLAHNKHVLAHVWSTS